MNDLDIAEFWPERFVLDYYKKLLHNTLTKAEILKEKIAKLEEKLEGNTTTLDK